MPEKLPLQLWEGPDCPMPKMLNPVRNYAHVWAKPAGGLWTSSYDPIAGSEWVQWCLSEEWGSVARGEACYWLLEPDPRARVFTVDSLADLEGLARRFPASRLEAFYKPYVAWGSVAAEYDAVHLTSDGQEATRLTYPLNLYGWDCESTLWMRWKFRSVVELGTKTFERSDGVLHYA